MKSKSIIYTRTKYVDYRLISNPNDIFCPSEIKWQFVEFIRNIINTDNPFYKNIEEVRWSFYKVDDYILWGIGCQNKMLDEDFNTDYTGTPIRGFFGIIIKADENIVPYDIDYFKEMYRKIVIPIWENRKDTPAEVTEFEFTPNKTITANSKLTINTNAGICRLFPCETSVEDFFTSALASSVNVSAVSGLNVPIHATDSKFMNAIVRDTATQTDIRLSAKVNAVEEIASGGSGVNVTITKEITELPKNKEIELQTKNQRLKKMINNVGSYLYDLYNTKLKRVIPPYSRKQKTENTLSDISDTIPQKRRKPYGLVDKKDDTPVIENVSPNGTLVNDNVESCSFISAPEKKADTLYAKIEIEKLNPIEQANNLKNDSSENSFENKIHGCESEIASDVLEKINSKKYEM